MKIINKEAIKNYIAKYDGSLYVETWRGGKARYYLNVYTTGGGMTLGRVSKRIFDWFDLEPMEKQPPQINVSWDKFKRVCTV